ncbi:MAG TPA: hypothetical protein PKI52_16315 [Aggregatilineales bacterium]|nr:hypothetical protein [Aggregatilineales bacterium]
MTQTLAAAIAAIQDVWLSLQVAGQPAVKAAPAQPTESMTQFPFVVTYPARARVTPMAGWTKSVVTLYTEFHMGRSILPRNVEVAIAYYEPFLDALRADITLGGSVDAIVGDIRAEFGYLEWAGEKHVGWRFEIDVKQQGG